MSPPVAVHFGAELSGQGRNAEVTQSAMEAHRLLSLIRDLWLDDKEVDIAVGTGFSARARAEQDHLRFRGSCSQAATRLGNQSLVNPPHYLKS